MKKTIILSAMALMAFSACNSKTQQAVSKETLSGLNPANFESTVNGKKTELFTLKHEKGM